MKPSEALANVGVLPARRLKLGDGAIRLPLPRGANAAAAIAAARASPGVVDAWSTEAWLAIEFAEGAPPRVPEDLDAALASPATDGAAREHAIDVVYDGVDLEDVARAVGLEPSRVAELHSRAEYTVLFVGFLPGFGYLGGVPPELEVPRLPSPRVRVPKNAVAIGGPYAGVYPFESPGGWRILGTARGVALFNPDRGALLRAGDRVRFRRVG